MSDYSVRSDGNDFDYVLDGGDVSFDRFLDGEVSELDKILSDSGGVESRGVGRSVRGYLGSPFRTVKDYVLLGATLGVLALTYAVVLTTLCGSLDRTNEMSQSTLREMESLNDKFSSGALFDVDR